MNRQQELDLGVEEFVARIGLHLIGADIISREAALQGIRGWSEEAYRAGWRRCEELLEGESLRAEPGISKVTEP